MVSWQAVAAGQQDGLPFEPSAVGGLYPGQGVSPACYQPPKPPVPVTKVGVKALFDKMAQAGRKPKKVAVILRGLPGSGKTEIARKLREQALERELDAPRIHSIDDYFMAVRVALLALLVTVVDILKTFTGMSHFCEGVCGGCLCFVFSVWSSIWWLLLCSGGGKGCAQIRIWSQRETA